MGSIVFLNSIRIELRTGYWSRVSTSRVRAGDLGILEFGVWYTGFKDLKSGVEGGEPVRYGPREAVRRSRESGFGVPGVGFKR